MLALHTHQVMHVIGSCLNPAHLRYHARTLLACFSAARTPFAAVHVGDLGVQDEAIPLENRNEPRLTGMRFNGKLDPPI